MKEYYYPKNTILMVKQRWSEHNCKSNLDNLRQNIVKTITKESCLDKPLNFFRMENIGLASK